ncbi:hypothetical protein ABN09_13710, partial [Morganella morganii]
MLLPLCDTFTAQQFTPVFSAVVFCYQRITIFDGKRISPGKAAEDTVAGTGIAAAVTHHAINTQCDNPAAVKQVIPGFTVNDHCTAHITRRLAVFAVRQCRV